MDNFLKIELWEEGRSFESEFTFLLDKTKTELEKQQYIIVPISLVFLVCSGPLEFTY